MSSSRRFKKKKQPTGIKRNAQMAVGTYSTNLAFKDKCDCENLKLSFCVIVPLSLFFQVAISSSLSSSQSHHLYF
jgi:hypothetical protein